MEMCWDEDPNKRPESFSQIKKTLNQIHEQRRSKKNASIIDTFLSLVFSFVGQILSDGCQSLSHCFVRSQDIFMLTSQRRL